MTTTGRWPAKLWEQVVTRAQEGHPPAFRLMLAWGRIVQERKTAWQKAAKPKERR